MILLELALGFGIGLSLGLLGGGGSILTVPALVYLVGQTPHAAVTTSLALTFGSAGMLVSYLSANISKHFSAELLSIAFAFLMLGIGIMLLLRRAKEAEITSTTKPWSLVLLAGAAVGLLTGILGVGGGFLVVPALVMLVGLPVQMAIGTLLVVIAMNSLAGFIGHVGIGSFDLVITLIFVSAGLVGTFSGSKLSSRLSSSKLQKAFAIFVIALAFFLLIDNFSKLL